MGLHWFRYFESIKSNKDFFDPTTYTEKKKKEENKMTAWNYVLPLKYRVGLETRQEFLIQWWFEKACYSRPGFPWIHQSQHISFLPLQFFGYLREFSQKWKMFTHQNCICMVCSTIEREFRIWRTCSYQVTVSEKYDRPD